MDSVELLKMDDVAGKLRISKTQAYRLCQSGEMISVRFGGSVRVRPVDLDEFIRAHLAKGAGDDGES